MGIIISKKSEETNTPPDLNEIRRPPIQRTLSETSSHASRKLWWTPKRNVVGIHSEHVKYDKVRPKIDSLSNVDYRGSVGHAEIHNESVRWLASPRIDSLSNASWTSSEPRVSIQHKKLKWNAQPKINSLDNINYRPTRAIIEIYDEKPNYKHVSPRINTGFTD